jgi:hypothetical protein
MDMVYKCSNMLKGISKVIALWRLSYWLAGVFRKEEVIIYSKSSSQLLEIGK